MAENPEPSEGEPKRPEDEGVGGQQVHFSGATARVPEKVGRGAFATGAFVFHGAHEFILDFVQRLAQPQQVAARVVVPPVVLRSFIAALAENLKHYQSAYGTPPAIVVPPGTAPVSIEEVYEQLKLPDDMLSGVYAHAALIRHSQMEFCIDFITNFFPRSSVSARIFLSAPHAPGLLASLSRALDLVAQRGRLTADLVRALALGRVSEDDARRFAAESGW